MLLYLNMINHISRSLAVDCAMDLALLGTSQFRSRTGRSLTVEKNLIVKSNTQAVEFLGLFVVLSLSIYPLTCFQKCLPGPCQQTILKVTANGDH